MSKPADVDDDLPAPLVAGPAPTPPMGWNSWNAFAGNITDSLFRQTADAVVSTGMRDAGYQYINIDDTWSTRDPALVRGADEPLVPDARKFPAGMAALADYVHGQGLKLGIYGDRGSLTCSSYPGSEGHEQQDAETFAGWGVDYLKYDNCPPTPNPTEALIRPAYTAMAAAIAGTGRSMAYSLCAWKFYEWGTELGSLWRTTGDIKPTRDSVMANLRNNVSLAAYAHPNGWNDPDMLEVGNFVLPDEETDAVLADYRAHFTLWAISAAPLITGNDLRAMSGATRQILTNQEVIALDQDALGYQGVPVRSGGDLSVWAKPLNESGARGVVLLNAGDTPTDLSFSFAEVGLGAGGATVRDLWAHADRGSFARGYSATVAPHDVVALRVLGHEPAPPPKGNVYLSDLPWIYAANGLGGVERDQSNGVTGAGDGQPIAIRGTGFSKGLGVAAPSKVVYRLARSCRTFTATVGVDDQAAGGGSVVFQVLADGEKIYESPILDGTAAPVPLSVDVTGRRRLMLLVKNGGDGRELDYASWGDAQLACD